MKFARFEFCGSISFGIVEDDIVKVISSTPFDDFDVLDQIHHISEIQLLAPTVPSIIFFMGGNYMDHLGEGEPPVVPQVYTKTPNSIIGPNDTIIVPSHAGHVQEEAELVAVIGKSCRNVSKADALDYVFGYTCGNDVSARDWQASDPTFWRAKASDTFSPIGPYIVTGLDPTKLVITATVNGEQVQHCKTSDMVHDTAACISYISQSVTLGPGDIIYTGTGGTQVDLQEGDVVEIGIEEIGVLSNTVTVD